jgi:voltage-gated potassium channel
MWLNFRLFSRVYYFIFLLIAITAAGTIGFMTVEDWSFVDAFYMTVITISTVGFGEVNELSLYGRLFATILIITSFGTFAYAVSVITQYIVGGEYKVYFQEFKTMKASKNLRDHVIICGFGRVGKQIAEDLTSSGFDFIIVEQDEKVIEQQRLNSNYLLLNGDATNDQILETAGIQNARALITCLPKDADNLYVVLAVREVRKDLLVISRASFESAVSKLRTAGANNVIMPDSIGGSHMASLISNPDVMEFMDSLRMSGQLNANITSMGIDDLPEKHGESTIGEVQKALPRGLSIIGIKLKDGSYVVNPELDTVILKEHRIFILGSEINMRSLKEIQG